MNPRMCCQVLDCGDGVCEVTALATLTAPKLADAETIPTQSGNSADSVAALQKLAHQPMPRQFMVSMRVQCRRWRLSMNRPTPPRRGALSVPFLGGVGVGSELTRALKILNSMAVGPG